MNALLLAAVVLVPGVEREGAGQPQPSDWMVVVEIEQGHSPPARVELVGFQDGKFLIRTREGLTAEVEESKVARLKVVRVEPRNSGVQPFEPVRRKESHGNPEPPGRPSFLPRTEDDKRYARNIREYLLPTPQRQALYSEYKRKGKLEQRKREILDKLPDFTDPANALSLIGDLFTFLHLDRKPKEEIARTLHDAAVSIKQENVRDEVVNTLKFFSERWQMLERFREEGLPRRRPGGRSGRWFR